MTAPDSDRGLFPASRTGRREDRAASAFRQAAAFAVEWLLLVYAVMIFCGIATFGQVAELGAANSNSLNSLSNALFISVFGLLTLINFRRTTDFLPFSYVLIAFVTLAAFSAIWSVEPGLTLRRLASLIATLTVAAYLTWRFDIARAVAIVGHGLLVVLVLSYLAVIFMPNIGITQYAFNNDELVGTWKGVLPTKNTLGWLCIAGVEIYAWRFLVEREKRLPHLVVLALFVFMAAETRSATAVIGIVLTVFLLAVLNLRRWQSPKRLALEWVILGVIGLAIFAIFLAPAEILALFGKDTNLTGRVPLWITVLDSIKQRPLLGYGYGAFWVNTNPEMLRVWTINTWHPPNSHNAFLDVTLDLGVGGLVLAVMLLLGSAKRALSWCTQPNAPWATYLGCLVIVFIVTSLDETVFLRGGDVFCLLISFCYFTLVRQKRRQPLGEPRQAASGIVAPRLFSR